MSNRLIPADIGTALYIAKECPRRISRTACEKIAAAILESLRSAAQDEAVTVDLGAQGELVITHKK